MGTSTHTRVAYICPVPNKAKHAVHICAALTAQQSASFFFFYSTLILLKKKCARERIRCGKRKKKWLCMTRPFFLSLSLFLLESKSALLHTPSFDLSSSSSISDWIIIFFSNLWHATNHLISYRAHAHPSPQLFRQLLCCYLISGFLFLFPPPSLFFYLINYAAEDILIFSLRLAT
jgi:hypothetical protein